MESIEDLKKKIQKNVEKNSKSSIIRPTNHLLEFLIKTDHSCNGQIISESLFNEGKKESFNLFLFGGAVVFGIIYSLTSDSNTGLIISGLGCIALIPTLMRYFDKGEELRVDSNGLLIRTNELIEWPVISYMYFRTDWDGEGNYPKTQLIVQLENGKEKKIDIDNLNKNKDQIGQILYCAIKQFKKA